MAAIVPSIPLFRYGAESGNLALMSGPLLFDSGEADRSFLFRCQDRLLAYNSLCGLRSLLLVTSATHAARYRALWNQFRSDFSALAGATGLPFPVPLDPLFVPVSWSTLEVTRESWFFDQNFTDAEGICLNQVSPTAARLIAGWNAVLGSPSLTLSELSRLQTEGRLALKFHDKAEYLALTAGTPSLFPPHAATAILSVSQLLSLNGWEDARSLLPDPVAGRGLYLKSAFDSGGNFGIRLDCHTCADALAGILSKARDDNNGVIRPAALDSLLQDLALSQTFVPEEVTFDACEELRAQLGKRTGVRFLLQELIQPPPGSCEPASAGICCLAGDGPRFAAGQVFRDPTRRHFLGSYLNDAFSASVLDRSGLRPQVEQLCRRFCELGYRGPVGFDACASRDPRGWTFIADCNPRLSAVYPALAVQQFLRASGFSCEHIVSLGYRGEFADGDDFVQRLGALNARGLLAGPQNEKGILLLPNLSRRKGVDALLVNVPLHQSAGVLDRAGLRARGIDLFW